jgi:ERCC4-type nuclease
MKVIIDEREKELYEKCYSIVNLEGNTTYIQLFKQVLPLGDILIHTDEDKPVLLIERKTFADLLSSIKDGRYEEQSYRLSHSNEYFMHSIVYLIEGLYSGLKSQTEKKTIYSAMTSLNYFKGFSVFKTSTIRESAEFIIWMANKIDREMMKGKIPYYLKSNYRSHPTISSSVNTSESAIEPAPETTETTPSVTNSVTETMTENGISPVVIPTTVTETVTEADYCSVVKKVKRENITPENIGEIILCQIPGIHSATAISIMKQFRNFPHFIEELNKNPNILDNIQCSMSNGKSRKINKTCVQNIKQYLLTPSSGSM